MLWFCPSGSPSGDQSTGNGQGASLRHGVQGTESLAEASVVQVPSIREHTVSGGCAQGAAEEEARQWTETEPRGVGAFFGVAIL